MPEVTTDTLLKAINSPSRRNILYIVYKEGRIKYSDLMKKMNLDPTRRSGWFSYHVQVLVDALLLEKEKEDRFIYYRLTELGKKTVDFLKGATVDLPMASAKFSVFGKLNALNFLEASWSLIFFMYSIIFLAIPEVNNLMCCPMILGIVLLSIFCLMELHLIIKVKSITALLFLNVYWIFLQPPKWKTLGGIIALGMISFLAFGYYVENYAVGFISQIMLLIAVFLLIISVLLSWHVLHDFS